MSKVTKWYNRYRIPFYLTLIVISVSGSLILLAYQGANIQRQSIATEEQVREVKRINEQLVRQSEDQKTQIDRVISENQKQSAYLGCLLGIQGILTDEIKMDCEQQAEVQQQSESPSSNSSPTPTDRPLPNNPNIDTSEDQKPVSRPKATSKQEFSHPTIQPQGTRETIDVEPEEEQQQPQANSLLDDLTNLVEGVM